MSADNRQIVLAQLPQGKLGPEHFAVAHADRPTPNEGEVLLRILYVSLDAANRAWMQGATYRSALEAGSVMAGGALAEVVESRAPSLKPGDLVFADTGWQEWAAVSARGLFPLPRLEPLTHLLSVFGVAGLTAYFGLLDCGRPKAGETVAVSAAAGSVGSIVGQIAKIKGCRVVGIAGGAAKCALLQSELGFDAAVDYKAGDTRRALRAACPDGIDVYFDNVGGDILEAALFNMNTHGRIACCGAVSQYDGAAPPHGPRGVPGLIVTQAPDAAPVSWSWISTIDERRRWPSFRAGSSRVSSRCARTSSPGMENLPAALIGLLAGDNVGKRMVKII